MNEWKMNTYREQTNTNTTTKAITKNCLGANLCLRMPQCSLVRVFHQASILGLSGEVLICRGQLQKQIRFRVFLTPGPSGIISVPGGGGLVETRSPGSGNPMVAPRLRGLWPGWGGGGGTAK